MCINELVESLPYPTRILGKIFQILLPLWSLEGGIHHNHLWMTPRSVLLLTVITQCQPAEKMRTVVSQRVRCSPLTVLKPSLNSKSPSFIDQPWKLRSFFHLEEMYPELRNGSEWDSFSAGKVRICPRNPLHLS